MAGGRERVNDSQLLAGAGLRFKANSAVGALYGAVPVKPTVYQSTAVEVRPTFGGRKTRGAAFFNDNVEASLPQLLSPTGDTARGAAASAGNAVGIVMNGMCFASPLRAQAGAVRMRARLSHAHRCCEHAHVCRGSRVDEA